MPQNWGNLAFPWIPLLWIPLLVPLDCPSKIHRIKNLKGGVSQCPGWGGQRSNFGVHFFMFRWRGKWSRTLSPAPPAPVVYKFSGSMGGGFLYTTGAEAESSALNFSKESVPPQFKIQSPSTGTGRKACFDFFSARFWTPPGTYASTVKKSEKT